MRKLLLPAIALGLLSFALMHVVNAQQQGPAPAPPVDPARTPFGRTVAGSGIVEARTENIAVGAPLAGIVTKVHVKVDQDVQPTESLFELDSRALDAELGHRRAALKAAEAQLHRLDNQPRKEDRDITAAKLREAETNLADQRDQLSRARALVLRQAISDDEKERREFAFRLAEDQYNRAKAEHALVDRGAWEWDKAVARAAVEQARALMKQTEIERERLTVRALTAGRVLQVNVRPGEYVGASAGQTLIMLGDVKRRRVRVDIDENDIHRFRKESPALAKLRGSPSHEFRLTFVRVEPYVIPKKSLTGDSRERVDTRVLQVIYEMEPSAEVHIGQLLDVFIESEER